MKKVFFIILLLMILSLASHAQNSYVCQPDTILLYTDHSIIEGDSLLIFNAYDANGLFEQCAEHYVDDGMKGELARNIPPIQIKTNYEYDLEHNMVKMVKKGFSSPRPGSFISKYKYEGGKLMVYVRKYSDSFTEYIRDSILYQYDFMGRIKEETVYGLHGDQLIVCKFTNDEYASQEIRITTEGFGNGTWGDWLQLYQETCTFDEDSVLSHVVSHSYEQPTRKETDSYDGEGQVTTILTETYDGLTWVNSKLLEYSYDANGRLLLAEIKSWQEDGFVPANRAIYELNASGYPVVVNFEKWNGAEWEQGTWQSGFYVFSEDHLKRQNDFICRKDAKRIVIHYVTTPMPDYDLYEHSSQEVFAFVHPNPTNGLVSITGQDLKTAEVFNTLGQRMATAKGNDEQMTIDLNGLPAGVYFVTITDKDGRKCVRKVVKE